MTHAIDIHPNVTVFNDHDFFVLMKMKWNFDERFNPIAQNADRYRTLIFSGKPFTSYSWPHLHFGRLIGIYYLHSMNLIGTLLIVNRSQKRYARSSSESQMLQR